MAEQRAAAARELEGALAEADKKMSTALFAEKQSASEAAKRAEQEKISGPSSNILHQDPSGSLRIHPLGSIRSNQQ